MKSAQSVSHSTASNRVEDWLWSQRLSSTASQLIVSLMMALLMVPVVLVGQRIFPGWDGSYLIGISLVISLEAMFARRRLRGRHFPEPGWLIFRITEWVVILVALKFLMYGLRGSNQIWNDLISWRQDFLHRRRWYHVRQRGFHLRFGIEDRPVPTAFRNAGRR